MTLTLDLPTDLERELAAEADRLGLPLPEYALRVLAGNRVRIAGAASAPRTGADLVAYWEEAGVVGSRPDIQNPSEHARDLRGQAERRLGTEA